MTNIDNGGKTPVAGIIHAVVLLLIFSLSILFFFPSQNQSDDSRIALPAFCHMVALEVEFEDEILGGIQCLASLAEPVAAVALCQLDNLGTDMFQKPDTATAMASTRKNWVLTRQEKYCQKLMDSQPRR